MSQQLPEEWFVRDARVNALISWALTLVFAGVAVLSFLGGLLVHMSIAVVVVFVTVVPPLVSKKWTRTISWPLLLLGSLPLILGASQPSFFDDIIISLSVAMLAMLVVVTLQMTTTVRMTPRFAVFFVILATLATAGVWAVGSALSATYLGTAFLETNEQLMYVFTAALLAGGVAGLLFRWYFRRQLAAGREASPAEEVVA
ncbi:hypothetical protein [Haloferax sp. DFSO60]|uniref:hypothetical protein n=1 Tax=Haloferax sp. DFSO60 TaxID=3388652 RepID=UPI003979D03B